jgi:alpha-methylacyl-CoA racemase
MSLLQGLKILDFTSLLPGPYATMILADLGATVLKVEAPDKEDMIKSLPPKVGDTSSSFEYLNRNKKSISIDLNSSEGIVLIKKLLSDFDIVIESFRPYVMKKFGLDYHTLKSEFPELIYCSISGYGHNNPYSNKSGHDINFLGLSGLSSLFIDYENKPLLPGIQIADIAGASLHAVISILSAVISRQANKQGCHIDLSIRDTTLSLAALQVIEVLNSDQVFNLKDGILTGGSHYNYYHTKDGAYLAVGSLEQKFLLELSKIVDTNLLGIPTEDIKNILQSTFASKNLEDWLELFGDKDLCIEPVYSLEQAIDHEITHQRGLIVDLNGQKQLAHPVKFSDVNLKYNKAPVKNEHCNEFTLETS